MACRRVRRRSAWFYIGIIAGSLAAVFLLITLMVWATMRSIGGDGTGLGLSSDTHRGDRHFGRDSFAGDGRQRSCASSATTRR